MNKKHRWLTKGRWQRYSTGQYIYREDTCACGCTRRVTIDEEGKEVVESYTMDDNTSVAHIPCIRKGKAKSSSQSMNGASQRTSNRIPNLCNIKINKHEQQRTSFYS